ncbi:hypothetical protein TNCV_323851 [Trichonephila clavipes]|nr:hypothetical protein TNCV_323851 [Trichonephila clavipes]
MLPVLGKKAVLEWCMKEGLIGSSYVCPKCGKSMELRERMDIIKMGRTILLERRQSESVGRRNSRTTFLRSDWPRPFARREVGVEMELGRSENKRPEQRRS